MRGHISICRRLRLVRESLFRAGSAGLVCRRALRRLVLAVLLCAAVPLGAVPLARAQSQALLVGDSLTTGYYATTAGNCYGSLLQTWLSAHGYQAVTLSAFGGRVVDMADAASLDEMRTAAPDLAVLELGTNDCSGWPSGVPTIPADFEAAYRQIVEAIRQSKPGALVVMAGVWKQTSVRAAYDGIIQRLAADYGALYVSLESLSDTPALSGPAGLPTFLGISDAFHPNDDGHAAIAASVEDAITWQCGVVLGDGSGYTRHRAIDVSLSAVDRLSAVEMVRQSLNGAAWSAWAPYATSERLLLPAGDGLQSLSVEFRDTAGSVSLPLSAAIVLETHGPKTQALTAARALPGRRVKLRFRVLSALCPQASVRIAVRSSSGRVVRLVSLGLRPTGRVCTAGIVAPFRRGNYRYEVRATDLAGNRQTLTGTNALVVRQ
jgi:lysophospholipase L1-like esterase